MARAGVLQRLIDADPAERVRALEQSRRRGWLEQGELVVTALVPAEGRTATELGRMATALQADSRGATWVIGAHEGCPVLVTSLARASAAGWDLAARLAERSLASGTAIVHADEADILPAVTEACRSGSCRERAEELHAAVGESVPIAMLLEGIGAPESALRRVSPAAFALWHHDDRSLLETVETYLDAGARVSVACRLLHIHRTTLYYRLDNLPDLVREELSDGWRRSVMHLVLKILRLRSLDR